ncbi:hypothetical protein HCN44_005948 [Aphidius gifuensis]|uniref:Uncharacterized protein n=1 Tax=Aphidius gifuensis TaxID=684658 RepID=A0A834XZX6_APHGI|nr:hypothetical protein HCN44_005948 [Aphidius gifuensis]
MTLNVNKICEQIAALSNTVATHSTLIAEVQQTVNTNTNDIEEIKENINNNTSNTLTEIEDRISRRNNIIIYNLTEPNANNSAERQEADKCSVQNLITSTGSNEAISIAGKIKITRIGKIINVNKSRLVKVICNNTADCNLLMNELIKLKARPDMKISLAKASFAKDKTKIQQQNYMQMKMLMQQRITNGEQNLCIREINGNYIIKNKNNRPNLIIPGSPYTIKIPEV